MASVITATTTSGLTQSADNSGVLQLASGTGNLVTIPSVTGTAMVSGNMPAFSAFQSSAQTLSNSTRTKIIFQSEEWDTANCFDSTTNYRFTPNVAGYYIVNASMRMSASFTTGDIQIYKNGFPYKISMATGGVSGTTGTFGVSCQVFLNGTTDFIECYGLVVNGQLLETGSVSTWFQASMVRGA